MKEQSKTAYLKPVCRIGPDTAEGFQRTATQRISSWPGDSISTNRPNTLTQTFFFVYTLFPCTQTADHTFGNYNPLGTELAGKPTLRVTTGLFPDWGLSAQNSKEQVPC